MVGDETVEDDRVEVFLFATSLLAGLGDAEAWETENQWVKHQRPSIRKKVLGGRTFREDVRFEAILEGLRDRSALVRREALQWVTMHPDARFGPAIAPLLTDGAQDVPWRARVAMEACQPTDSASLAAALKAVHYEGRDPSPTHAPTPTSPPSPTPSPTPKPEVDEQYSAGIRSHGLRALNYYHESLEVQASLLDAWDKFGEETRGYISTAFRYCPDRAGVIQDLKARVDARDTGALYALAMLQDPDLREFYEEHARAGNTSRARAGLIGLAQMLRPEDAGWLKDVWRAWYVREVG